MTVPSGRTGSGSPGGEVISVTVRYFAAAWAAAGMEQETVTVPAGATVADLLGSAAARHGAELQRVLERCSYLRNAVAVRELSTVLGPGDTLDVLPPFAGG